MSYDALVVGGGIAGMESALNLGDMGFKVLLLEKEASIGGKMILLSKVFPTLDCASCISTPKMAATAHHPNVTAMVHSGVESIVRREDGRFQARIKKRATYVNPAACTGCGECELACTVASPDEFNADLALRRAAHIPFPQAVPKKALIERAGTSPCSFECPAGVKAHGYIALVRAGRYEEAFALHMEDAPLVGSLSRACYAPCEGACTRGGLEGPLSIRGIKRFLADRYYAARPEPEYGRPERQSGKRVAVVGSGPAGLSAAYFLAKEGHEVVIFEAAAEAGGMLRYGIPAYRLPREVLDRDIKNVTALGVTILVNRRAASARGLLEGNFDAVFVSVGTRESQKLGAPGEDLEGVMGCMDFLIAANTGRIGDLKGKSVVVVGGGNSAIDPARLALRLGAAKVAIMYRRSRREMPAHDWEVRAALEEGIQLQELRTPVRFLGENGRLKAIEAQAMRLGEPDASGRRRPVPVAGSESAVAADLVVVSIGLTPSTAPFAGELICNRNGTLRVDERTLETSLPGVFAGGDAVTGPSMIVQAIGQGHRAAFYIGHYLQGNDLDKLDFNDWLPVMDRAEVIERERGATRRERSVLRELAPAERVHGIVEVEHGFTEEEARAEAARCLDCGVCSECHACVRACPAGAIDFSMRDREMELDVGAVVVASGFRLFNARAKKGYGYGRYPNVIDAMQMDRILAPTRPYNAVVRPSDGKVPDNIAYVLCTGSRDCTLDNRLCSRVCCMYSLKQAQLIMGAVPLADVTIYYIDIRAFGKGYEEFFQQARDMGVMFVKGKVAEIREEEDGNLALFYEDIEGGGGRRQATHDLAVLSVGLLANPEPARLFAAGQLQMDPFSYVREPEEDLDPGRTSIPGVFVAGTAAGIRDIPDTILHAGAAAAQAAAYLQRGRARQ
ncbi:MAG: FAD-dependent oxidoreductase [Bryobacteraceae bacterium]